MSSNSGKLSLFSPGPAGRAEVPPGAEGGGGGVVPATAAAAATTAAAAGDGGRARDARQAAGHSTTDIGNRI